MRAWMRLVFLVFTLSIPAAFAGDLVVNLSLPTDSQKQQIGVIEFTLTNEGHDPIDVLKYKTPFVAAGGGLPSPLFQIVGDSGTPVPYTGKNVKFVGAQDTSFIHLAPGQSITTEVNLAKDYDLKNGHFKVTYDAMSVIRLPLKTNSLDVEHLPVVSLKSNDLSIWINASLLNASQQSVVGTMRFAPSSTTLPCTSGQSVALSTALASAVALTADGIDDLTSTYVNPPDTQVDPTWTPSPRAIRWLNPPSLLLLEISNKDGTWNVTPPQHGVLAS